MIRVLLPGHLRTLAKIQGEVLVDLQETATCRTLLNALENQYPMLQGTIREHGTLRRRPFLRFFACGEDLSLMPADAPLPEQVLRGEEPFLVIASVAGGC